MKKQTLIVIIFISLLISCNSAERGTTFECDKGQRQTFQRDVPKDKNGKVDNHYISTESKASQLRLDSLADGYDCLQIRIWCELGLVTTNNIFIIKSRDGIWSGEIVEMTVDWEHADSVVSKKVTSVSPKSGWQPFIQKLTDLKIMSLPDMGEIPKIKDNYDDGDVYSIEVATMNKYRFYSYHVPHHFQDKVWQAKNMVEIIKYIREEFKE